MGNLVANNHAGQEKRGRAGRPGETFGGVTLSKKDLLILLKSAGVVIKSHSLTSEERANGKQKWIVQFR